MKAPLREQLRAQSLPEDELSEAEQQLLRAVLDRETQAKWAQTLAEKGVRREAPSGGNIRNLRPWLAAAAAVLLLGIAGWWLWGPATPDAGQVAEAEMEESSILVGDDYIKNIRSENETADQQRDSIQDAYSGGHFQKALDRIAALITAGTATEKDHILAGFCYLNLPEPDYNAAINAFLEAGNFYSGPIDDLQWYLGLSYTLNGEKEKALEALRPLVTGNTRKKEKAAALIEALERD